MLAALGIIGPARDERRASAAVAGSLTSTQVLPRRQPAANLQSQGVKRSIGNRRSACAREAGKDVTKDDREIVSAVHRALADKVGQERFAVWFGRGVRME